MLGFCTSWKGRLRQSSQLTAWHSDTGTQSPLSKIRRLIGSRHWRKYLPNYKLTTNLSEQRFQWPKMTKNTDFIGLSQNSHQRTNSNSNKPWEGGDSDFHSSHITCGEGKDNPLQYSCLESSMDRGTWKAKVHGFAKSQTWDWAANTHTHITLFFKMSIFNKNLWNMQRNKKFGLEQGKKSSK